MGAFLSEPIKDIEYGGEISSDITAYSASMQGWRSSQEDAHLIKLNFDDKNSHIFGVFDGHGSDLVSNYVAKNFISVLCSTEAYKEQNYSLALEQTFMKFDEILEQDSVIAELSKEQDKSGGPIEGEDSTLMKMFRAKFQDLIKEKEDDDSSGSNEEPNEKDDQNDLESSKESIKSENKENNTVKVSKTEKPRETETEKTKESEGIENREVSSRENSEAIDQKLEDDLINEDENDGEEVDEEFMDEDESNTSTDMQAMMADSNYEKKFSKQLKPQKDRELPGYGCGTTANVVLISEGKCYIANAGDSRSILCRENEVIALSSDHGPEVETEKERILNAGGLIIDGRVNGGLNLTRAIGDLFYKRRLDLSPDQQMIISKPDVKVFDLKKSDLSLILACDGIWNSHNNEETAKYFAKDDIDIKTQIESLFMNTLADGRSPDGYGMDNMTIIYVSLNKNNSEDDIAEFMKTNVKVEKESCGKKRQSSNDEIDEEIEPPAKISK